MEKEVRGCSDCPFKNYDYNDEVFECIHPNPDSKNLDISEYADINHYKPGWCPLKQESITIKLK